MMLNSMRVHARTHTHRDTHNFKWFVTMHWWFLMRNKTNKCIWHSGDCASWHILIKNQRDALISQIYSWNRTLHVSDRFSVHHQESSTVYTAIGVCHTLPDSWWWTETLSKTCRVLFQKQIWEISASRRFYYKNTSAYRNM